MDTVGQSVYNGQKVDAGDVVGTYGITNANPQFGNGGLSQYYVSDVQDLISKGILTPVDNIKLYK